LMLVAFHNSDMGDGWEREGQNYEYFRAFFFHFFYIA